MNEGVLLEMAKQIPAAVALIITVALFLNHIQKNEDKKFAHDKELETQRALNAKNLQDENRAHAIQVNLMWANNIKMIVDQQTQSNQVIANALHEHELASRERYEKMGVTDDLLQLAKEKFRK